MTTGLNDIINYGTAKFKVVKNVTSEDIKNINVSNGSGIPIGAIVPYTGNELTPPTGFLFCDGSALSRETYSDLFEVIGTIYGSGDGSTTFNIPDLNDGQFLEGSSTAGTSKEAGIPNIKGQDASIASSGTGYSTGAFRSSVGHPTVFTRGSDYPRMVLEFDASRSSSIYKDDVTTVQPKSLTVRYIIKFIATSEESDMLAAQSAILAQQKALEAKTYAEQTSYIPVGTILPYSVNSVSPPNGFLFCEGQAVSRTMYNDLFTVIGTTFGNGDGSTTFNLPDMRDRYPQGSTTAGTVKSAGLPNITGGYTYARMSSNSTNINGALYVSSRYNSNYVGTSSSIEGTITLDASRANSIYGNSDTVTPPTLTVRYIIKAFDGIDKNSTINISECLTRQMVPAFNKRDVITTSGTYVAQVTGWYRITVKGGGGGGGGCQTGIGGGGGGEGGTAIAFEKLTTSDTASVVIGAGGIGGGTDNTLGTAGGDSTVTVNNNTYTGGGGKASTFQPRMGGAGGSGTIPGCAGCPGNVAATSISSPGGSGGGFGGGVGIYNDVGTNGVNGGGGAGGFGASSGSTLKAASNGGDGYVCFEYFDDSI